MNKTLAELEESYRKQKPEWILPDNHNIRVNLFADMETYRILTHSHAAGGHVSCWARLMQGTGAYYLNSTRECS